MDSQEPTKPISENQFTNFIVAIKSGAIESIDNYLKKYGAEISNKIQTQLRQPPLYFAINLPDDDTSLHVISKLLEKGANPHFKDNNDQTIIFYAFRDGKKKCIDLLVSKGVRYDEEDTYGQIPLYYAANENRIEMLDYFDKPEYYNHRDKVAGQTPLYYSAKKGYVEMCKALIAKGCDPMIQDSNHKNALEYARRAREHEVSEYLSAEIKKIKDKEKEKEKQKQATIKLQQAESSNLNEKKKQKKIQETVVVQPTVPRQVYKIVRISDNGETKDVTEEDIRELLKGRKQHQSYFSNPETIPQSEITKLKQDDQKFERQGREKWQKTASKIMTLCWKAKGSVWFHEPVDPVKFGIMDYFDIVTHPMDFSTIKKKLAYNFYADPLKFKEDVLLVFNNCYRYNGDEHEISLCARDVEKLFLKHYEDLLKPIE